MKFVQERLFHKLFFLAAVVYAVLLLIGPKVTEYEIATQRLWLVNVYLPGPFGISLNKDSFYYMDIANNPAKIFEKGNMLQSRPLLPLLAHFPSIALQAVLNHLPGVNTTDDLPLGAWTGSYLAFLGANVLILAAALTILRAILKSATAGIAVFSDDTGRMAIGSGMMIGFLFIANDLTKAFFFAAHAQMFNIFVPLINEGCRFLGAIHWYS